MFFLFFFPRSKIEEEIISKRKIQHQSSNNFINPCLSMNTFKGRQLQELARRRELLYFKRTGVKKIAFPLVIASRNTICCTGAWRINLSKYSFMPVRGARNAAQSSQKDDERRF